MEEISFPSRQGLVLSGTLHRPLTTDEQTSSFLIICHGFRGSREGGGRAVSLGQKLAEQGFYVLRFDFSGNGESEGEFADSTLSGYIRDLEGAVDYACTLTSGRVSVIGRSLGGATAICTAARDRRIHAVCTWAAPVDFAKTFIKPAEPILAGSDSLLKIPEGAGFYYLKRDFFDNLREYDIIAEIPRIAPRPVLVIHGTADETVSFQQGVNLYNAALEPKDRLLVEGGDHRFLNGYRQVEDKTIEWLKGIYNN